VNSEASRPQPTIWVFWLACGVAAAAGAAPIVIAGAGGRVSGVIVPLLVAAAAYAACALLPSQGKMMSTGLYFLAGLATLFGVLAMLALPLQLAIVGTCPPAPAVCAAGLQRPLTAAESTGIGFAAGLGILAIFLGFFGLVTLYRRLNAQAPDKPRARRILPFAPARQVEPAPSPPVRRIPPVVLSPAPESEAVASTSAAPPSTEPEPAAPEPASEPAAPEPRPELAAPEPRPELPAPAPELELPAHVDASPPTEAVGQPAPAARPRRKRDPRKGPTPPDTTAT